MPKFDFKPITRPIDLADYAPEYQGATVHVWVNMPRATLADWYALQTDAAALVDDAKRKPAVDALLDQSAARWADIERHMNDWLAAAWSQHADVETHWSADDVRALSDHLVSIDPQAWYWLTTRSLAVIREYRNAERKN